MTDHGGFADTGYGSGGVAQAAPPPARAGIRREQAAAMRRAERDGVPFWCHRTGFEATVKLLSLADRTMLAGIPAQLQAQLTASLTGAQKAGGSRTFSDLLRTVGEDEQLANAFCIAGFVWPRLVAGEEELDGSDDCWVVTDLHIDERKKYLSLVMGGEQEEMAKIASFLRQRVAGAAAGGALPPAAAAQRPAGDAGGGVWGAGEAGV